MCVLVRECVRVSGRAQREEKERVGVREGVVTAKMPEERENTERVRLLGVRSDGAEAERESETLAEEGEEGGNEEEEEEEE